MRFRRAIRINGRIVIPRGKMHLNPHVLPYHRRWYLSWREARISNYQRRKLGAVEFPREYPESLARSLENANAR